jgi:hypothetical protein
MDITPESTPSEPTPTSSAPSAATAQLAAPALRASDQDRDATAAVLSEALAQGRLTSTELAERIDATYAAKTVGELAPLTADLPALTAAPLYPTSTEAGAVSTVDQQEVSAVFSKVIRRGRWVAGRHTHLRATFGALIVDLTEAVLPGREVTFQIDSFCGKAIITVPRNARILDEGGALFGKRTVTSGKDDGDEDGPLIRLTGSARFGKIAVRREGQSGFSWHDR